MPIAGCNDGGVYNTMQQSGGELGGMTLRDYFAAKAMAAIIVDGMNDGDMDAADLAAWSYRYADAMLDARKENK